MFDGNRVIRHTRSRYPIFPSPMTWIARSTLVTAGAMGLLENSIRDLTVTKRGRGRRRQARALAAQCDARHALCPG